MRSRLYHPAGAFVLFLAILLAAGPVQGQDDIETILAEADTWIITDTTRIMSFIEESNRETLEKLRSSSHWASTYDDLSFLLSIDYVGDPQIDNTGRMYYIMRITGQTGALFYTDQPMGFPHQLTPNNWDDIGRQIGYYHVHPSGDYLLVATHLHGNENYDIYTSTATGPSSRC